MSVIVRDNGFSEEDWQGEVTPFEEAGPTTQALDVPSDVDSGALVSFVKQSSKLEFVRIIFPKYSDGRGFTLAKLLRDAGYIGKMRASGHVVADQYTMARRSGFDEVEIDDAMAERQPEAQWLFRSKWQAHDYQSRLRAAR